MESAALPAAFGETMSRSSWNFLVRPDERQVCVSHTDADAPFMHFLRHIRGSRVSFSADKMCAEEAF